MRGRCKAPGLRRLRIIPQLHEAAFAFTTPLGLDHPMARAHAKLLGPCFKTGQRGHRPTRNRDAARASETLAIRDRSSTRLSQSQERRALRPRP